jgi:hypothetical protein
MTSNLAVGKDIGFMGFSLGWDVFYRLEKNVTLSCLHEFLRFLSVLSVLSLGDRLLGQNYGILKIDECKVDMFVSY